jgi:flagellar biosynthetic protein FliR
MTYLLVHLRLVGMMFTSPLFFSSGTPIPFRFLCVSALTVAAMGPLTDAAGTFAISAVLFESWVSIFFLALRELFVGVAIGLFSTLPLAALQVAGEQASVNMGFSMASVMDPLTQRQTSIVGQLQFLVGLWFYFRWNGHLLLVQAVAESLRLVPPGTLSWIPAGDLSIGGWLTALFRLAIKIVVPIYGAMLLADIGLGFLARTVPQMNIFVLGLPLKIAVGFFVLTLVLPLSVDLLYGEMERWLEFALAVTAAWR